MGRTKRAPCRGSKHRHCEACGVYVVPNLWQQHISSRRHQRNHPACKTFRNTFKGQSEKSTNQAGREGPAVPWTVLPSRLAAIVGTGAVYHKAMQYLSNKGNLRKGRLCVDHAARGNAEAHSVAIPPQQVPCGVPLDLQIASACVGTPVPADMQQTVQNDDQPVQGTPIAEEGAVLASSSCGGGEICNWTAVFLCPCQGPDGDRDPALQDQI